MENGGFHLNSPAKNTDARIHKPGVVAMLGLADYLYSIHAPGPESKKPVPEFIQFRRQSHHVVDGHLGF
jgi:hypothetical protein